MAKYDYLEALCEDIRTYFNDELDLVEFFEDTYWVKERACNKLNEDLWDNDSVTGNGYSGYCTEEEAGHNLAGNWNLLGEALSEFGCSAESIAKGAKFCDTTIRCYLLSQAVSIVVDEMYDKAQELVDDDEEEE